MPRRISLWLTICVLAAGCASPPEQPAVSPDRGGDLYGDSCNACHTAQIHWRDKRVVRTWDDLRYQVSRWQKISGLNWSGEEINDVAAYLNQVFYDLPCPRPGCGSAVLPLRRS
jgi:mono/diheme cytochrome c family protein